MMIAPCWTTSAWYPTLLFDYFVFSIIQSYFPEARFVDVERETKFSLPLGLSQGLIPRALFLGEIAEMRNISPVSFELRLLE
jgi:hypothetical protein